MARAKECVTSEQPVVPSPTPAPDTPRDGRQPEGGAGLRRLMWLLPALTFVVGLVLGAVVVGAITSGADSAGGSTSDTKGAPAGATATPTSSRQGDLTVTVPAECAALADDARDAAGLLDQAATAARNLDASALADIVRRMQGARDRLAAQSDACRANAGSASVSSS